MDGIDIVARLLQSLHLIYSSEFWSLNQAKTPLLIIVLWSFGPSIKPKRRGVSVQIVICKPNRGSSRGYIVDRYILERAGQ